MLTFSAKSTPAPPVLGYYVETDCQPADLLTDSRVERPVLGANRRLATALLGWGTTRPSRPSIPASSAALHPLQGP